VAIDRLGRPRHRHRPLGMGCKYSGPQEIDGHAGHSPQRSLTATTCRRSFSVDYRYAGDVTDEDPLRRTGRILRGGPGPAVRQPRHGCRQKRSIRSGESASQGQGSAYTPTTTAPDPIAPASWMRIINHMGNFFDCVVSRQPTISDVVSQHRCVSTCHLGNISIRLEAEARWDPQAEQFVGDDEANRWLKARAAQGLRKRIITSDFYNLQPAASGKRKACRCVIPRRDFTPRQTPMTVPRPCLIVVNGSSRPRRLPLAQHQAGQRKPRNPPSLKSSSVSASTA